MIKYLEAIDGLPVEIKLPLMKAFELFREEIAETVRKSDFDELKKVVGELAEAQKRTEQRVEELAQAQKKSEERLTRLEKTVQELAEAQKRTEQRVEELAEAQKRTEQELRELAVALKETRQMVGNLSDTVGYSLEDRAIKSLPQLLRERYGIEVKGRLVRKYVKYNGKFDEINIFGSGIRDNKEVNIIGEAKSRLSKGHVDDLLKLAKRLSDNGVIIGERFLFIITYTARPEAEEYSHRMGVEVIWSFDV